MTSKTLWRLRLLTRKLWIRATLISLMAVAAALVAILLTPYLPDNLSTDIGAEAVDNILSIIASSMLAVTTFSLSTMVTAYGAATSNVTPRATRLIMEDSTTQNVLAAFVGSFLFSLVAIITLAMGAYGDHGWTANARWRSSRAPTTPCATRWRVLSRSRRNAASIRIPGSG